MTTAHQEWRESTSKDTFQEWCRERDRTEAERLEGEARAEEERAQEWDALADKAERAKDGIGALQYRGHASGVCENAQVLRSKAAKLRECVPCE